MALIKPIHGEMKGSIGGNTWQGGKFGQVVRQRRKPVNPNSESQAARWYSQDLRRTLTGQVIHT